MNSVAMVFLAYFSYAFNYPNPKELSLFPCYFRLAHPAHVRNVFRTIVSSDRLFSGQYPCMRGKT